MKKTFSLTFGGRPLFRAWNSNHTPYNKRPGSVEASSEMRLSHYDGSKPQNPDGWLNITIEETVHHESGRCVTKTLSHTLDAEGRKMLLAWLTDESSAK